MSDRDEKKPHAVLRRAVEPEPSVSLIKSSLFAERFSALRPDQVLKAAGSAAGLKKKASSENASIPRARTHLSRSKALEAFRLAKRGARLIEQGEHTKAIETLKSCVQIDPTVAAVQHNLGLACLLVLRLDEAADALSKAVKLNPKLPSAQYNLALCLDYLGRENEALVAYEAAMKLVPERHQGKSRLGQLYLQRGRRAEAEAVFREAANSSNTPTETQINEAQAADAGGRTDEAEAILRALIKAQPDCAEAYVTLADILAHHGRAAEATICFERCIALEPKAFAAWQGYVMNKKFSKADQPAIEKMLDSLNQPKSTPNQRKALHFALGKAYDDIGQYGDAMAQWEAANRIRTSSASFDPADFAARIERLIASTPPGYLDRRSDLSVNDETPLLIVGMPRSGTTLVEQILSSHPDVAAGGELSFWGENAVPAFTSAAEPDAAHRIAKKYLEVLHAISPNAARVTDKMPYNFSELGLIRQLFPRATIVHCRRNPIDTCISMFANNFITPFNFSASRANLAFVYRQYQRLMAHWRRVLPADRFIEVDYEELVSNPEPLTRQMVATCGLEWSEACLAPQNNQRRIATSSLWQARQPIYRTSVARWKRYEPWLGELRELLPEARDDAPTASHA